MIRHVVTRGCIILLLVAMFLAAGAAAAPPPLSPDRAVALGERMYREGLLPSGEPMEAMVKGDIPVDSTAFSCISCHMRSGLGSIEGGVYTPPTNASILFQPLKKVHKGVEVRFGEAPLLRPAYTDTSLAEVIRSGLTPSGRMLNDLMPRYLLEDDDMALLVAYLKELSSRYSPGVTDTELRFATVISEDADPADRDAMLGALDKYMADKNNLARNYQRKTLPRDRMMAKAMSTSKELEVRRLSLARWVVKGPPETWHRQLEEYNRKEPVFALLGGLVTGDWQPVHQFCEEHRIPCLFPNTDFPVVSETDWYTLYLSKGYYQEGEAAARYLKKMAGVEHDRTIVQVVRASRRGLALAAGFEQTLRSLGQPAPVTFTLDDGDVLSADRMQRELSTHKPAAVVIWDGPTAVPLLQAMTQAAHRPDQVILSAGYLGKSLWSLPEPVRDFVYLAYPYRLPQDKVVTPMGGTVNFPVADNKVAKQTYALVQVLSMAVMQIKGNYYRDNLLDVIGMSMDRVVPLYERLSFGPGQRYASKGCYIVQLGKGEQPQLVKKSPWVIH